VLGCSIGRKHEIEALYDTYDSLSVDYSLERILEKRDRRLRLPGLYSDDTPQALALLHVYLDGGWDTEKWCWDGIGDSNGSAWRAVLEGGTGGRFAPRFLGILASSGS
jgi:hypothetical protein